MSIMTEASAPSTGFPLSSTYDMGFGDSDVESSGSDASEDGGVPKDYWFGRKYFECVIAQNLLQHTRLYEAVAVIDSRLEEAMQKFPYVESLKALRLQGLESLLPVVDADPCEAYRTTMSCVGAIVRNGDRKQKATLLAIIRHCATLSDLEDRPQPTGARPRGNLGQDHTTHPLPGLASSENVSTLDMGRYASALKEYGDQHGFIAEYDVRHLSSAPSRFEASVTLEGQRFEGTARSKRQARHEAASQACYHLGINT